MLINDRPLKLLVVSDGITLLREHHVWTFELDGDADSLEPQNLCSVLERSLAITSRVIEKNVFEKEELLNASNEVLIVDFDYSVKLYTASKDVHEKLLLFFRSCLPDK